MQQKIGSAEYTQSGNPCASTELELFLPNNHSRYEIRWRKVAPELAEELRTIIVHHYPFDVVRHIRQLDEWERMSNNFRLLVVHNGGEREVLFRKHIQLQDEQSVALLDRTIEFLGSEGVSVPQLIRTGDNRTTFREGDYFYTMYEFISGDHYCRSSGELEEAARGFALLHRALAKIPFGAELMKKPELLPVWSRKGWEDLVGAVWSREGEIDAVVKRYGDFLMQEVRVVEENLGVMERARKQFIHCDPHPHNTIFQDGALKALLDFEGVRWGELVRDAANACHRFVRQFVVFHGGRWQETLPLGVGRFLTAYTTINHLDPEEILLFPMFIRDELLRKLFKDLGLYYYKGSARNIEGGELEKKLRLLKEATAISEVISSGTAL